MLRAITAVLIWISVPPAVQARHVYITVEMAVLHGPGGFTGLRHKWTFDKAYAATMTEGLRASSDGQYDLEKLAEQLKLATLKDHEYYTFPKLAGQPLKVSQVGDYRLEHKDGLLSLHFTLSFERPVPTETKGLTVSVHDRSSFITFEFAGERSVRLGEGAPKGCAVKLAPLDAIGIAIPGPNEVLVECTGS